MKLSSNIIQRLGWAVIVVSLLFLGNALWIPAKAEIAQLLLKLAWEVTLETGEPQSPWPWADHYPVARFSAHTHGVDQIVLSGDSGAVLAFAPGQNLEALREQGGARIISGHRDTHFRFLKEIRIGDELKVEDAKGAQVYRVVDTAIVDAKNTTISPAAQPGGLILVTCYPFDVLAPVGDERFIVIAEPIIGDASSNAAESTLPGASGGMAQLTNVVTNAVTDAIGSRQNVTRGLSSGDSFMTERHVWLKPFGGWTQQDNRQGVSGYDVDSYGLALGVDGDVSSSWNVGAAFAYVNSDVDSTLAAGSHQTDMDSYLAKVYATKLLDEVTALNLQAGAGVSDYDSSRRLFTGDVANADYDSWHVQFSAELERSFQVSAKTVMTPYVHADYSYVNVDGYRESGAGAGALSLNINDDSADSLIIGTGVKANHAVSDSLLLMANAGIGYDLVTDRSRLTSSFAGGGAQFATDGIELDEWVYNAGVGAKYSLANGTEITAAYTVDARHDYTDQSVSVNFRMMF